MDTMFLLMIQELISNVIITIIIIFLIVNHTNSIGYIIYMSHAIIHCYKFYEYLNYNIYLVTKIEKKVFTL